MKLLAVASTMLVLGVLAQPAQAASADPHDEPISDARLRTAIDAASAHRAERGGPAPLIAVEVFTSITREVSATVASLGGVVTGHVEGAIVQALVPAGRIEQLVNTRGVGFVRAPRQVTRPPQQQLGRPSDIEVGPGLGATVGANVAITNAAAWQAAGIDGSVKVGIIDYFDLGLWNPAENGPVPDAAHRFCLDTSGSLDGLCPFKTDGVNDGDGFEHGVAVAQVLRDMAPAAELYIASAGTVSDMSAAIDWFAANGVHLITRSLGAAYDGPGDGTGPLALVVDKAASYGITWFNSAGNDAIDGYSRVTVPANLAATNGYVDFDAGPGVDTLMRLNGYCVLFDGVRWNDWAVPPGQRSDYVIEAWRPLSNPDASGHGESYNPGDLQSLGTADNLQTAGAPPLELVDDVLCGGNDFGSGGGISYISIRRKNIVEAQPDILEVALGSGFNELGRGQAAYSAAKPVVDSRNINLIAVGAIDPANGTGSPDAIGFYSSQGPTNDGRIKPDVSAPSCVASTIYSVPHCFNGTSAASPTAAGIAALLLDAGVALPGAPLASAIRHFVLDRSFTFGGAADGPDNKYGFGEVRLPAAPAPFASGGEAAYTPLTPVRILDTRPSSPVGGPIGAVARYGIVDLAVAGVAGVAPNATAVAVNITTTETAGDGFVQTVPYLGSPFGASSTLNVADAGVTKPNFAIVPVGTAGKIAIYDVPGGHLIVDVLGYFAPTTATVAAGRFVPIDPVRALDTRTSGHVPGAETVVVPPAPTVPTSGVSALVLNVTSTEATTDGFLRAQPTGTTPPTSTVNFVAGVDVANTVVVPLGADNTVSIYTNNPSHIIVDVTGYITNADAPVSAAGRFVPIATTRAYDSRNPAADPLLLGATRSVQLTGLAAPLPVVPAGASGISVNLTATDEVAPGFLTASSAGAPRPETSSVNYLTGQPIANAALLKLSAGGALDVFANQQTHFVIDVNGYFT